MLHPLWRCEMLTVIQELFIQPSYSMSRLNRPTQTNATDVQIGLLSVTVVNVHIWNKQMIRCWKQRFPRRNDNDHLKSIITINSKD